MKCLDLHHSNVKKLNLTNNHYSPGDEETKKTFPKQDGASGGSPHLVNG